MELQTTQRVATNVRSELAARRIKPPAFASLMGWPKATAHRRMRGEGQWPIDDVERAARVLGLDVAELLVDRERTAAVGS